MVIDSGAAEKRGLKTAPEQLLKLAEAERKAFKRVTSAEYSCEADAIAAVKAFERQARLVEVHDVNVSEKAHHAKRGRPSKDSVPERVSYHVTGCLAVPITAREERVTKASRFILATNDVMGESLSDAEVLLAYKDQSKVERGFRFIKDPLSWLARSS